MELSEQETVEIQTQAAAEATREEWERHRDMADKAISTETSTVPPGLAVGIMDDLMSGRPVFVDWCPGNGSRYEVLFTPITPAACVNGSWPQGIGRDAFCVVISLINYKTSYPFNLDHCPHPSYLGEKLFAGNVADGEALEDLIVRLVG